MKTMASLMGAICVLASSAPAPARGDLLVRQDETALQGTFKGGTDAAVLFESGGQARQIAFKDVLCLLFAPRPGAAALKSSAPAASGSTTVLRTDGGTMRGVFKGGTDAALLFEVAGAVQQLSLADVRLVINDRAAPAATAAPAAAAPAPAAAPAAALAAGTVPAGTKLMISLTQNVTSATHAKGAVVEGVLATPLAVGGQVFAPEGTKLFGKVLESRGGRVVGGSYIMMSFTEIQIGNQMVPISTSEVGAESGAGGTAKTVGAGALIGAAAGDAGVGAAIGGAAAVLSSRGNHVQIPKGTKAEVTLKADVKIGG